MKNIIVAVEEEMFKEFKKACVDYGRSMTKQANKLMQDWLKSIKNNKIDPNMEVNKNG